LLQCFPIWFFYGFFSKLSLSIFLFNIELVKNYNYNKAKSYKKSVVIFLTKHCGLLQYFSKWFFILFYLEKHCSFPSKTLLQHFFSWIFFPSKIIFVGFFNIKLVKSLALYFFLLFINRKLNHIAKTLYLSSQNTVDCYKSFYSVSKFLSLTQFFFPS
jgi:hypothetical protein